MDFVTLDRILQTADASSDAAEAHGTLCGLLCQDADLAQERWLANLTQGGEQAVEFTETELTRLVGLVAQTRAELGGVEFAFQPCLPPDAASLDVRVGALAFWCQGFLYGLALGGMRDPDGLPGDVPEVLGDFADLTRASADPIGREADDNDETAFAELVEFVRVGVQLVYEELRSASAPPTLH